MSKKKQKDQNSFTVMVKINVEYDADKDFVDEVMTAIEQEVNYQFKYRRNGIRITGSEIQEVTL